MIYLLVITIFGGALQGALGQSVFSNPILDQPTNVDYAYYADTIYHTDGDYFLVNVNNSGIFSDEPSQIVIRQSPILTDFNNATISIPLTVPLTDVLESAVMQKVNGSLYLYFTKSQYLPEPVYYTVTIYVMIADDPNNPMGTWSSPKPLFDFETVLYQVYGSVMEHDDELYWVGIEIGTSDFDPFHRKENIVNFVVYKMKSPMEITERWTLLANDTWDCFDSKSNCYVFDPHVVYNMGVNYVVYTTIDVDSVTTSLRYISIAEGKDPMNSNNWTPPSGTVFTGNVDEDVYLVETASFTKSPDGNETWMVYHASSQEEDMFELRPRIELLRWDAVSGKPEFPVAHGYNNPQPVPSGQV